MARVFVVVVEAKKSINALIFIGKERYASKIDHSDNNAAKIIRQRFLEDVLRKALLEAEKGIVGKQLRGRKISRFAVKKIIDNHYKAA